MMTNPSHGSDGVHSLCRERHQSPPEIPEDDGCRVVVDDV